MRDLSFKTGVSSVFTLLFFGSALFGLSGSAYGEESSVRLSNPFLLPQTSLTLGSKTSSVRFSNLSNSYDLKDGGINTFGFDLEVNSNDFMNIGAFFRLESLGRGSNQAVDIHFTTILGGFTRFFYVPPFLKGKSVTTNLFTKLELGAGPTVMGEPSGLIIQGSAHIGVETYFNKWLGVSLSYGKVFEWGKETFASGVQGYDSPYRGATIWNQGSVFLASVKTTFL